MGLDDHGGVSTLNDSVILPRWHFGGQKVDTVPAKLRQEFYLLCKRQLWVPQPSVIKMCDLPKFMVWVFSDKSMFFNLSAIPIPGLHWQIKHTAVQSCDQG